MNKILAILLLLVSCMLNVRAEAFQPFNGPRPLAVMLETDPWNMVIASDTPRFVLYEDGQVIYRKNTSKSEAVYMTKRLTAQELQGMKASLRKFGPFGKQRARIELSDVSDQSETNMYLHIDDVPFVASVYGMGVADLTKKDGRRNNTPLPTEIRDLYNFLVSIDFNDAKKWEPELVEVMAWRYEYAPEASISWPAKWPGLTAPTTIVRREGQYSIFMPGSELKAVTDFLATRKAKGAIEIDGRKCTMSLRPVFPSEPVWRKAFRE